jgi:hypothetical protein
MQKTMKALRRRAVVALLTFLPAAAAMADTTHTSKLVAEIQPPQAAQDCVYFRLDGVSVADGGVLSNNPYFALPRTHVGFKEIYALLMSAYLTGTTVSVRTTGAAAGGACGVYVGVNWMISP